MLYVQTSRLALAGVFGSGSRFPIPGQACLCPAGWFQWGRPSLFCSKLENWRAIVGLKNGSHFTHTPSRWHGWPTSDTNTTVCDFFCTIPPSARHKKGFQKAPRLVDFLSFSFFIQPVLLQRSVTSLPLAPASPSFSNSARSACVAMRIRSPASTPQSRSSRQPHLQVMPSHLPPV